MSNEEQKSVENLEQKTNVVQSSGQNSELNFEERIGNQSESSSLQNETLIKDEGYQVETQEITQKSEEESGNNQVVEKKQDENSEVALKDDEVEVSEKPSVEESVGTIEDTAEKKIEAKIAENEIKQESKGEIKEEKTPRQKYFDQVFEELKEKMQRDEVIEVEVKSRIRGGLRVHYKDIPLFLPASHLSIKRNPSEEELNEVIDKVIKVQVHEYQEFDEGRKAVIVSRRKLALKEVWDSIKVGDVIEGRVSSVPSFGVFVEFNGLEGLIHISRLSRVHVRDPKELFKKGDKIKAKIIEIDRENNKIALSRKEVEESLWKGVENEFPAGTRVKGVVKRFADFGAYVEIKHGIEGLLLNSELSWTRRYKRPSEVLKQGQEIEVEVLSISEKDERAQLSLKRTLPNPWYEIKKRYPIGSEYSASVIQVIPQGAIIHINDELDGFMPRSKMKAVMKGKKIPYKSGDKLKVIISDINPDEQSLILEPKVDEEEANVKLEDTRKKQFSNKNTQSKTKSSIQNGFSIGDFLSESDVNKLKNMSN